MIISEDKEIATDQTTDNSSRDGNKENGHNNDNLQDNKVKVSQNMPDLHDDLFYSFDDADDAETITFSDDDVDTEPYDSPLYQNQLEDPKVQNLMFQEMMDNE